MLKRVNTKKTSCSHSELIYAFIKAWINKFGSTPKKESIGVLYAQNALETGSTLSMWNWNIGNIKAVDNPNEIIEYCVLNNVWEIINGKRITLSPDNPGSWFRAFPTLLEGVEFHFNFLRTKRYSNAWKAVEDGSPAEFAHLLKVAKYYTAPEADYIKSVSYYFNKFMKEQTFENALLEIEKESKRNEADTYDEFSNAKKETSSPINKAISLFKNLFNR